jgi:hypothetical protein
MWEPPLQQRSSSATAMSLSATCKEILPDLAQEMEVHSAGSEQCPISGNLHGRANRQDPSTMKDGQALTAGESGKHGLGHDDDGSLEFLDHLHELLAH